MKYFIILVFCLGVQAGKKVKPIKPYYDATVTYQEEAVINEDNFFYPCPDLDDLQCIRKYLSENSDCEPAYGRATDPLYLDQITVFFPLANMTNILAENTITGLACSKVDTFFVNTETNNLVIAIEVTNLKETIKKSIYRYRRTGKEPIILTDYATVLFRKLIFTIVIQIKDGKICYETAEFHADIREDYPAFSVGPKAYDSEDPDVQEAFQQFVKYWPMLLREAITSQVTLLSTIFIQKTLCDFGFEVKSI